MSLEESDFVRLQKIVEDGAELASLRAMKEHFETAHKPLVERMDKANDAIGDVRGDMKIYKGIGIGFGAILTAIEAFGAWLRHGGGQGAH